MKSFEIFIVILVIVDVVTATAIFFDLLKGSNDKGSSSRGPITSPRGSNSHRSGSRGNHGSHRRHRATTCSNQSCKSVYCSTNAPINSNSTNIAGASNNAPPNANGGSSGAALGGLSSGISNPALVEIIPAGSNSPAGVVAVIPVATTAAASSNSDASITTASQFTTGSPDTTAIVTTAPSYTTASSTYPQCVGNGQFSGSNNCELRDSNCSTSCLNQCNNAGYHYGACENQKCTCTYD